ncbi:MAG TPA: helix-turn-helix domain-containing protein [Polyangiales bacterium]|nr:helix-turn-helix domain-containing protein [Polyangiales bacterium]
MQPWAAAPTLEGAELEQLEPSALSQQTPLERIAQAEIPVQSLVAALQPATTFVATVLARGVPMVEVAHELGFADQAHFSRVFKRVLGVTPSTYTRSARRHVC